MIITIISIVLLIACLVATIWIAISLEHNPPLAAAAASWLTRSELGQFEEKLPHLIEVILVADEIDVPTKDNAKEILTALIDNFSEKVSYNFIVPEQYAKAKGEKIKQRYYTIIDLAKQFYETDLPYTLFQLHSRPVERDHRDYPYIFYRFISQDGRNEVVAFRGEDAGEGIANYYRRLEPEIARSFLFSVLPCLATTEQPIETKDYVEFTPEENIIKIPMKKEGLRENERGRSIPKGSA